MSPDSVLPGERTSVRTLLTGAHARIVWAIVFGVSLHAFAWFLIATAMPSIVLDLDAVRFLSPATSVFLATSVIGSASTGWIDRHWGRRRVIMASVSLVLLGSLLVSLAPNISTILVGRALQGVGDGMALSIAYILVGTALPERSMNSAFAILSVVWAAATLAGPVLAGTLTETVGWRFALLPVPLIGICFAYAAWGAPPSTLAPELRGEKPPFDRLIVLGLGAAALSLAGEAGSSLAIAVVSVLAIATVAGGLLLDRRASNRLFPADLLSLVKPASLGIWIMSGLYAAEAAAFVFVPYFVQVGHDKSPFVAGQFASLLAIAWSVSSLTIARRRNANSNFWLVAGPVMIATGLGALAAWSWLPLWLAALPLMLIGAGFGACYGFFTERIVGAAETRDRDLISGAIPTLESIGAGLGAAGAGLIGTLAGFGQGSTTIAPIVPIAVFGASSVVALLIVPAALRFVRHTRPPA